MRSFRAVCIVFSLIAAFSADAFTLTKGRILSFHADPVSGCPSLDWYLVVTTTDRFLTGIIAWDDMKNIGYVSGSVSDKGKVRFTIRLNGVINIGMVDAQFPEHDGWFTAHITGAGCLQQDVKVPWTETPPK